MNPSISIVTPMYNVEKYIETYLNSLLRQTYDNFEVVIVDDCSTDNSVDIVNSYIEQFNGKLTLLHNQSNSGNPGIPTNLGLTAARGDYVLILDADDYITDTALEELHNLTVEYNADIICCERYYQFSEDNPNVVITTTYQKEKCVTVPTLVTNDLAQRVHDLYDYKFIWNMWARLVRRELIINNNVKHINGMAHDCLFFFCLMCLPCKVIKVPNIINYYRVRNNSHSHTSYNFLYFIKKYIQTLHRGFNYLNHFLNNQEYFKWHPDVTYLALQFWIKICLSNIFNTIKPLPDDQIYQIFLSELSTINNPELFACILARMNMLDTSLKEKH